VGRFWSAKVNEGRGQLRRNLKRRKLQKCRVSSDKDRARAPRRKRERSTGFKYSEERSSRDERIKMDSKKPAEAGDPSARIRKIVIKGTFSVLSKV